MKVPSLKAKNITAVVGFMCVVISSMQIYSSILYIQGESRNRFDNDVRYSLNEIRSIFKTYEQILYSVKSFYGSSKFVDSDEFDSFISPIISKYNEISSIGWSPVVKESDKVSFIENAVEQKFFSEIKEKDETGKMITSRSRDVYYPITYIYPLNGNKKIMGYDLGSSSMKAKAIGLALKYNFQTSTRIISSEADKNNKIVMMFTPVYKKADPQGIITGILELNKLFSVYNFKPFTVSLSETRQGESVYKTEGIVDKSSTMEFNDSIKFANKDWFITVNSKVGSYENDYTNVYKLAIIPIAILFSFLYLICKQGKLQKLSDGIKMGANGAIEKQFKDLFDNSLNEIFIFDAETLKFTIVNEKAKINIGYSLEELKKMHPYDIKPEVSTEEFIKMVEPLLSGEKECLEFNTKHERKDGTLYDAEIRLQMYNYNERRVFLAIILDITDKQTFLAELKRNTEKAENANKAKSEFIANISHELRTPLNSLLILAEELYHNDDGNLSEDEVESAKIIHNGGMILLNLINDILDFSKVESGKIETHIEEVEMKHFVDHIRENFSCVAKDKDLSFNINIDDSVSEIIKTDVGKVEQILRNFLSNAFKFTEEGGVIVNIGRPLSERELTLPSLDPSKTIAFEVVDTGIGISSDDQKDIFKAFQQADGSTSRKYGGTGLGLAITNNYTKLLGGEIKLVSEIEEGSSFTLYIPEDVVVTKKPEKIELGKPQKVDKTTEIKAEEFFVEDEVNDSNGIEKETEINSVALNDEDIEENDGIIDDREDIGELDNIILVIEDDLSFAKILRAEINKQGAKCVITDNGNRALELAMQYMPDAIISDIELPGINGIEVFSRLNSNSNISHIPIYFISINDTAGYVLDKGAIGYLTKPVSKSQLHTALKKIKALTFSSSKEILIIEENESIRKIFERTLIDEGFVVTVVDNAEDGLEVLRDDKMQALIISLNLPGMSGIEMLKTISQDPELSQPAVIVYSERKITENEEELISKYANTFIFKQNDDPEVILRELMGPAVSYESLKDVELDKNNIDTKDGGLSDDILKGKSVLLVDDDIRNIFALSKILKKRMQMTVFVAENGQRAIDIISKERGGIDIVLMDIKMPVMNGYEATKKIREIEFFANLPIIAITEITMKADKEKCLNVGATDYLRRPINVDELFVMMKKYIASDNTSENEEIIKKL